MRFCLCWLQRLGSCWSLSVSRSALPVNTPISTTMKSSQIRARAFAILNLASGLFGGQIAGGSMAPSAVNDGTAGRTEVSSLITWVAVILTLLFLTPLFKNLPEKTGRPYHTCLVGDRRFPQTALRKNHSPNRVRAGLAYLCRRDLYRCASRNVGWPGCAILVMIYRSSRPHLSVLGKVPRGEVAYSDVTRHLRT